MRYMKRYEAILFDLDNTLLDRDQAGENIFDTILDLCYGGMDLKSDARMLQRFKMLFTFKQFDNNGYSDKRLVLDAFFDEYPPQYRIPSDQIKAFWNANFPKCFTLDPQCHDFLKRLRTYCKIGIITNGSVEVQSAKIRQTGLDALFDIILISDGVGVYKPDQRIFELALENLSVSPDQVLFVGDNLETDIGGSQGAGIRGLWFNPKGLENPTNVRPYAQIESLEDVFDFLQEAPEAFVDLRPAAPI